MWCGTEIVSSFLKRSSVVKKKNELQKKYRDARRAFRYQPVVTAPAMVPMPPSRR
jgi:hypothetical protein